MTENETIFLIAVLTVMLFTHLLVAAMRADKEKEADDAKTVDFLSFSVDVEKEKGEL